MPILSYGRALSRNAERNGEAVAFVHDGQATTHAELEAGANRLVRAYARLGVVEGDFVTIALQFSGALTGRYAKLLGSQHFDEMSRSGPL